MSNNAGSFVRTTKKLTALSLGSFAVAAAFMTISSATANAEVEEVAPSPIVTSRQALIIDRNALRRTAIGNVRGQGETRRARDGEVRAHGEVRDSVKAVTGTNASPFLLPRNAQFRQSAPIGSW